MERPMDDGRRKRKNVHILLVDPDEEVFQTLHEPFQEAGYFFDWAPTGRKAMNMAKEFFHNLAIVEVHLPDMSGLEFLRVIKEVHPDAAVVLITANPSLESSVEALHAGASAFLLKPIQREQMIQHINKALDRQNTIIETRELLFAERKKREFYQYLSIRDGLTDLYNHRHFFELLNQEMLLAGRNSQPLSLLMMDIDNFKKWNDSFGHPAGDYALQLIARQLREKCRQVDHVCRYGGEEFAVIAPETSGKNAVYLAKRLVNMVRKTKFQVYDSNIEERLTISVGVASYPADAADRDELIIKADLNLLEAKRSGKDCYFPASL